MADSQYIMVRMDRVTHKRLCAVRDSLMVAHEQGKIALEVDSRDRVSLDQVVNILIDARADHKKRVKRARTRKQGSDSSKGG